MTALLNVNNLHVCFETPAGTVRANYGVNLTVREGETTGIMGESGCGKTVLFLALMRLESPGKITDGEIIYEDRDLSRLGENELQTVRGRKIALVPQHQATALNPSFSVGAQLREAVLVRDYGGGLRQLARHRKNDGAADREIVTVLKDLALGEPARIARLLRRYPHQLSGGIRQRVLIAMALLQRPRLLIADEPTSALDQVSRRQLLELLVGLKGRTAMLIVSHDPDAIRRTCERVAVMYGGRIIESGPAAEVFARPRHPYTGMLLAAPTLKRGSPLRPLSLEPLNLIDFPTGCSFYPNCPRRLPVCAEVSPPEAVMAAVRVACHRCGDGGES